MSASLELNVAKKNLGEALGDSMKIYLQILKSWFRQKISREDFDHDARKLLTDDSVHLHNQFLLAILTKCHTIGASSVQGSSMQSLQNSSSKVTKSSTTVGSSASSRPSKSRKRMHSTLPCSFIAADPLVLVPQIQSHIPEPEDRGPSYTSREMLLPDIGLVHGRMIVTAWDFGLDQVEDDAVKLLMSAIEISLKNILTAVLQRRNGYHVRENKFKYGMGTDVPCWQLRNTALVTRDVQESEATSISSKGVHMPAMRPSIETGLRDSSVQMTCAGSEPRTRLPVSLFDVFDALQVHKSAIPSHTVYTMAIERVLTRLWHPSVEELAAEDLHSEELQLKRQIYAQHAGVRS